MLLQRTVFTRLYKEETDASEKAVTRINVKQIPAGDEQRPDIFQEIHPVEKFTSF